MGELASKLAPQVLRPFPFGSTQAVRDHELALRAPALVVLGSENDDVEGWMVAGQALARVLLAAHADGVTASFFFQPIELGDLRERLAQIVGEPGYPHVVFRLGYAARVPATPRRPVSEVLIGFEDNGGQS
jgi:hypothetical protein